MYLIESLVKHILDCERSVIVMLLKWLRKIMMNVHQ